jgi:hypothetical protein
VYTLISASVLALDLVRHPHGAAVADVVDRALALEGVLPAGGPADERAPARARLIDLADRAPTMSEALHSVTLVAAAGLAPGPVAGVSRALQSTLMGRLDDLVSLLRTELSSRDGIGPDAVEVVVDRVVAAWTSSEGEESDLRVLSEAWDEAFAELPPPPPPTVGTAALLDLLEAVARCDRRAWVALDAVHAAQHSGTSWSELVHDATRVAVAAGRTVDVARGRRPRPRHLRPGRDDVGRRRRAGPVRAGPAAARRRAGPRRAVPGGPAQLTVSSAGCPAAAGR